MALLRLDFLLALIASCLHVGRAGQSNPFKFLIVSTPRNSRISYLRISSSTDSWLRQSAVANAEMVPLITTGLQHPQGIAVDSKKSLLYVTDPDSKQIFAYPLTTTDTTITAGQPSILVAGSEARWVSVDTAGNVFFSEEPQNQIQKIPAANVLLNTTPVVAYDGLNMTQVSAPGAVASDAFHTYWVNKQTGTQAGSLIQASPAKPEVNIEQTAVKMTSNTDKSYGVCLGLNNIFYTQPASYMYGVKKSGGDPILISDKLTNPRGCAWDGDGTIYVADRGASAIYSFPGNMPNMSAIQLQKVATYEDAFGLAIHTYSGSASGSRFRSSAVRQSSILGASALALFAFVLA